MEQKLPNFAKAKFDGKSGCPPALLSPSQHQNLLEHYSIGNFAKNDAAAPTVCAVSQCVPEVSVSLPWASGPTSPAHVKSWPDSKA